MSAVDAVLWRYLALDILAAQAERRLPAPPRVPAFARETTRPGRPS